MKNALGVEITERDLAADLVDVLDVVPDTFPDADRRSLELFREELEGSNPNVLKIAGQIDQFLGTYEFRTALTIRNPRDTVRAVIATLMEQD